MDWQQLGLSSSEIIREVGDKLRINTFKVSSLYLS